MIVRQKDARVHSPSCCILPPERAFRDKKATILFIFHNVMSYSSSILPSRVFVGHLPSGLTLSKQELFPRRIF